MRVNLNATIKYKYTYNMPPAERSINFIIDTFIRKHMDNFMDGTDELWLSPYAYYRTNKYYQLYLDIDTKHVSEDIVYNEVNKLFKNKKFREYFTIVYSGNGYHISSNFYIDVSDLDTQVIKTWIMSNIKPLRGLDTSMFKDAPIRRIGYRRDENIWITQVKDNLFKPKYGRNFKIDESELTEFILNKLIPYKTVYTRKQTSDVLRLTGLHK